MTIRIDLAMGRVGESEKRRGGKTVNQDPRVSQPRGQRAHENQERTEWQVYRGLRSWGKGGEAQTLGQKGLGYGVG